MNSQEWHGLMEQGLLLENLGDYAGAERIFRNLAAQEDISPKEKVQSLDRLGRFLHERHHQDAEAVQLLESAASLARAKLDWQEPIKAGVLQNLARLYLLAGRSESCILLGQEVLTGVEQALGSGHAETARAMQNLAAAHYELKHWDRAESLLLRAKGIWESQPSPVPELAVCYNNLGRLNEERRLYAQGIDWHRLAVALRRQLLGDHPDTAFSLGNLGVALASAGQWDEAARTLEDCLACYARCHRTSGYEVEGYRRNLELCRKALAAGGDTAVRAFQQTGSQNDSTAIDLAALRSLVTLLPYDDAETDASVVKKADVPARSVEAERYALLDEIVACEWRMFQAMPDENGSAASQKNPQAFRLMRHMSHMVHGVPFLRSYAEDLRKAESAGRNFMRERFARLTEEQTLLPDPLLEEIVTQECHFLQEAARQFPRFFHTVPGKEFSTHLRCELASLSARSLELYAAEIRQARQAGKNLAQLRYAFLESQLRSPD